MLSVKKDQSKHTPIEIGNAHFSPRKTPGQLVKFDEYITTDVICIATPQKSLCLNIVSQQVNDSPVPRVCCCAMSKHKTLNVAQQYTVKQSGKKRRGRNNPTHSKGKIRRSFTPVAFDI